ncbi:MAG TPA: molybdopterin cofactor-binding domain-containing protein [Polyangiaceae bacterium]|nr:molybdopterin cofactor-binding domain-containing protein [Polyangiaceae bacterium]
MTEGSGGERTTPAGDSREAAASPLGPLKISRRSVLAAMNVGLGGLALGLYRRCAPAAAAGGAGLEPNVWLHIAVDGTVTYLCHRSEMGQGVRSSLFALVADELGADLARVQVGQADGDKKYGNQNTDGSSSVRGKAFEDLRRVGATAREMLVAAAAQRWRVKPETCTTRDHQVVHVPTGRAVGFGDLVEQAAKLPVPKADDVKLRPRNELRHLGGDLPLIDAPAFVTGRATYGADVRVPGTLVAVIARPPVVGGRPLRYDESKALAVAGVKKVVAMPTAKPPYGFQPWGGVAVIAENTWAAMRGRAALDITWDSGSDGTYDSEAFERELAASVDAPGTPVRNVGDVDGAFGKAARVMEAEYHVPHLGHLPMEPIAVTARNVDGRWEIWAPTQNPQTARSIAAATLGVAEDQVTVHVTFLGGAFGRKSKADFIAEVVLLARAAGAPVRLQWTREDDVQHDYVNAVSTQRLRAGLDAQGKITAWLHRTAFPPIGSTFGPVDRPSADDLQQGVLDLALDVPNVRAEACAARSHTRVGWYRSVYNIFHGFAIGSFVDEIAVARGQDARDTWLEFIGPPRPLGLAELGVERLRNYGASLDEHPVDPGRLAKVIQRVTELARWSERKKEGRALGLAAHRSFLSYAACVVAVVADARRGVRVDEAWLVLDAGTIVNADRVRANLQGAVVMGISNALFGGITWKAGAVEQSNFHDARVARIGDVPRKMHVEFVPSELPPCGVGEPGVVPVAPAIANAVFALTGKRIRELPIARAFGV